MSLSVLWKYLFGHESTHSCVDGIESRGHLVTQVFPLKKYPALQVRHSLTLAPKHLSQYR